MGRSLFDIPFARCRVFSATLFICWQYSCAVTVVRLRKSLKWTIQWSHYQSHRRNFFPKRSAFVRNFDSQNICHTRFFPSFNTSDPSFDTCHQKVERWLIFEVSRGDFWQSDNGSSHWLVTDRGYPSISLAGLADFTMTTKNRGVWASSCFKSKANTELLF